MQQPVNVQPDSQRPQQFIDERTARLAKLSQWILDLRYPEKRENALVDLARHRDEDPDLAILLWNSLFSVQILVQEIMSVYEYMNPPTLTPSQSNRACNALALLQCIASHGATRNELIECKIPIFLYPFLRTTEYSFGDHDQNQPFDFLRLTSLGVIGALVKPDDDSVTKFLLETEYMPMGLSIIEHGSELTKIVSTFILLRILTVKEGLEYCCQTYERFSHVAFILGKVVQGLGQDVEAMSGDSKQQVKLLNKIIRCYFRLCDNTRARKALRECLPQNLKTDFFSPILRDPGDSGVTENLLVRLRNLVKQEDI